MTWDKNRYGLRPFAAPTALTDLGLPIKCATSL